VLDPGCGNGKSAVWLAQHEFDVVGIDLSRAAINQARQRARFRHVEEHTGFYQGRFPNELPSQKRGGPLEPGSFGFVVERAFLQHVGRGGALRRTVDILAESLSSSGLLYSLTIASEGASGYPGIVTWSQKRIRSTLEPRFEIVGMELDVFTPAERGSMPAWITIAKPKDGD
jgi:2-polyprenyl-3-methyl-5-hydroxy-6-metoxy-1,4-benzoquinol methylase